MNPLNIKRIFLHIEIALQRANPLLLASLLLWILAAMAWLWLVPAWQRQLHTLQTDSALAAAMLHQEIQPLPVSDASLAHRNLDVFMATAGDSRHVEQQLRTLFVIARDLEMALPQGQYKLACDDVGELCNYRMQMPVQGSYIQVRSFIEQFLQAIPFASLDEVGFKRESVADGEIEARLGITLFARARAGMKPDARGR